MLDTVNKVRIVGILLTVSRLFLYASFINLPTKMTT